jgi:hypothetical protein
MNDQITNNSGNKQEAGSLHRVVSCRITSCCIMAAVERDESKLPDMRWKKLESGDFVLQIRQAEINGFDEDGVPHFSGRSWWADVPIWDEKAANAEVSHGGSRCDH